jgi:WD40-like Beta Propeller Repeat
MHETKGTFPPQGTIIHPTSMSSFDLMSVRDGLARLIAYVYGGQGTINVPSWSPDGKRLAFVSNSTMP